MSSPSPLPSSARNMTILRLAVLLTSLAVVLAMTLLIHETAYIFGLFMFLGPVLLALAAVGLCWVIFQDLRARRIL